MSEDFDKYLAIANHDIQMAKDMGELKSYVASLLYDNDKKVDMIHELEEENKRLNNIINKLERYINEEYIYDELGMKIFDASTLQDKLQELKGTDKE